MRSAGGTYDRIMTQEPTLESHLRAQFQLAFGPPHRTIAAIYITGWVTDRYSFAPILIGASVLPLVAMAAMLLLVRNTKETQAGVLNAI